MSASRGKSRAGTAPGNNLAQSTGTPRTHTPPNDNANRPTPPSPRRNDPTTVTSSNPPSTATSCTAATNTGCALTSTNTRNPSPNTAATASANNTRPRKFRNQYPPSNTAPDTTPPVTVE